MPNFRRYYIPNAIVFITCVTHERRPALGTQDDVALFFETLREVQKLYPFNLFAYVILPDHFHWLMRMDTTLGNTFSTVLQSLKRNYTLNYKKAHHINSPLKLWQARFWDHIIRDQDDLNNHIDYIHYNPVKHGYVTKPEDWPHSTYGHWQERGYYSIGWGHAGLPGNIEDMNHE